MPKFRHPEVPEPDNSTENSENKEKAKALRLANQIMAVKNSLSIIAQIKREIPEEINDASQLGKVLNVLEMREKDLREEMAEKKITDPDAAIELLQDEQIIKDVSAWLKNMPLLAPFMTLEEVRDILREHKKELYMKLSKLDTDKYFNG